MNNLVIIGNGFDLAHGLKTSYKDFILWYLNKALKEVSNNLNYSDQLISMNTRISYAGGEVNSLRKFRQNIDNYHINIDYKNDFLRQLISNDKGSNWMNIEVNYYSYLINLYKRLEKSNIDWHHSVDTDLAGLNRCFDAIKSQLIEYLLISENSKLTINKDIKQHLDSIMYARNDLSRETLFLNFNYTATAEQYLRIGAKNEIMYIHGN